MIALSLTAHENPRVVMELLSNIKYCYNNNAFLVVHVSADHKEAFFKHAAATNTLLFDDHIVWNDRSIATKWGNALPMQISNYLYLKTVCRRPFTHFQIISPANLIVARDMDQYISQYDIVMRNTLETNKGWMWHREANADERYTAFRQENGMPESLCARVDGMAVRDEIFGNFVRRLLEIYSIRDMQNLDPTYPMEETILPTFLAKYRDFAFSFGQARAKTFEPNEPELDVERTTKIVDEGSIAYLKRIAPQEDNPVRAYILSNFSYGRRKTV